ncbi:MAG: hypothetical protein PF637_05835 [Spirochaetes bacterium]|jgi:hypothetical protein|nr:hypothetical protein [Spirochaetota bacterium]
MAYIMNISTREKEKMDIIEEFISYKNKSDMSIVKSRILTDLLIDGVRYQSQTDKKLAKTMEKCFSKLKQRAQN